ncbi:MAG: hypothetical protein ACKVOU_13110 [Cytophagales bacterium]
MQERKTWKKGLSILLIFQILVALSLAVFAMIDFPTLLTQFGMKHQPDMGILQMIMTYNLVLSASICIWSLLWLRKGNIAGIQAGATVGLLIFIVSFVVFIRFDRVDMLFFDSIRAFLMVVFGVLAYNEQEKHQTIIG